MDRGEPEALRAQGLLYSSVVPVEEWAPIEPRLPPARTPRNNKLPIDRREAVSPLLHFKREFKPVLTLDKRRFS